MSTAKVEPEKIVKTPEERLAAREERETVKLNRGRRSALDTAQTALRRAQAAIVAGDEGEFDAYVAAAQTAINLAVTLAPAVED